MEAHVKAATATTPSIRVGVFKWASVLCALALSGPANAAPDFGDPFAGYTPAAGEYFTTKKETWFCLDEELTDCSVMGLEITFGVIGNRDDSVHVIQQFGSHFTEGYIPRHTPKRAVMDLVLERPVMGCPTVEKLRVWKDQGTTCDMLIAGDRYGVLAVHKQDPSITIIQARLFDKNKRLYVRSEDIR